MDWVSRPKPGSDPNDPDNNHSHNHSLESAKHFHWDELLSSSPQGSVGIIIALAAEETKTER